MTLYATFKYDVTPKQSQKSDELFLNYKYGVYDDEETDKFYKTLWLVFMVKVIRSHTIRTLSYDSRQIYHCPSDYISIVSIFAENIGYNYGRIPLPVQMLKILASIS